MQGLKRLLSVLLILLLIPLSAGCWNNRPINELSIVTAVGIDLDDNGKYILTSQVIIPSKMGGAQSGSVSHGDSSATAEVSSTGSTILEAGRSLISKSGKLNYLAHIQLLVIGENAARAGIQNIWDFFERDSEVSRTMRVIVAKASLAGDVLRKKPQIEQISAIEISKAVDNSVILGKSVKIQAFKVSELLGESKTGIVLGSINSGGTNKLEDDKLEGAAVIEQGNLVGYLNNEETRGYLFAKDQIKSTILLIDDPKNSQDKFSIEVLKSSGILEAKWKDGSPSLKISVKTMGQVSEEQGTGVDFLKEPSNIAAIEKEAAEAIRQDITAAVEKSQNEYSSDIFDFNTMLMKNDYASYKRIEQDWDSVYQNCSIEIDVDFHLDQSGLINRPAYGSSQE